MTGILAEIVLLLHFSFIILVVFGSLLLFINLKYIFIHLPSLLWGLYIEFSSSICPLTYLENWLLKKNGKNFYENGFIENYIYPLVYPSALTPKIQFYFGLGLLLINLLNYSIIFYIKFYKR